jgi:hypothetical protein
MHEPDEGVPIFDPVLAPCPFCGGTAGFYRQAQGNFRDGIMEPFNAWLAGCISNACSVHVDTEGDMSKEAAAAKWNARPDGQATGNKGLQIRIDNTEFLHDMAMVGREIMRCFGRASETPDFRSTVISELNELHEHLVSVNQIPEAVLVNAASKLLLAGGDPIAEPSSKGNADLTLEPTHQAAVSHSCGASMPCDHKLRYSDLPQSFFKARIGRETV